MAFLKRKSTALDPTAEPQTGTQTEPEHPTRSVEELVATLQNGEVAERRRAARELANHPEATSALAERLKHEPERAVRSAIETSLIAGHEGRAARHVCELLASGDAGLRNEARELLLALPGAEQCALELLGNSDSSIRMFAIEILAAHLRQNAVARLLEHLEAELDVNVCMTAVEYLSDLGDERCLPALTSLQRRFDHDDFTQFVVERAKVVLAARPAPDA